MAPMTKIREVEESSSEEPPSSSSKAMREILTILSGRSQTTAAGAALLKARERISQLSLDEDPEDIQSLENALSESIWRLSQKPRQSGDEEPPQRAEALLLCLETLLSHMATMTATPSLKPRTLLLVTSLTDPLDPWSSPTSSQTALSILSRTLQSGKEDGQRQKTAEFIVDTILQSYLRPLFSRASSKVTASGRPSAYQDPTSLPDTRLNQEIPAWKKEGPRAVTVFRWAITNSDEALIKDNWPLFTPVLLTIAESEDHSTRLSGLDMLTPFIQRCPPGILHTTGIATVFEEAVLPSLLHLPSLTPEPESVRVITAAYTVLVALVEKHEDSVTDTTTTTTTTTTKTTSVAKRRRELLDRILRRGIFTAYDHASQYVGIVEVLMRTMATVVDLMGIHAVKHLQRLLSIINTVMADPFMVSHPSTMMEALRALISCILTCWPRLVKNQQEQGRLLRIIGICWVNMHDGDTVNGPSVDDETELGQELKRTARIVSALQRASETQPPLDMSDILAREPLLSTLFQA